jgi:UPF0755 protein
MENENQNENHNTVSVEEVNDVRSKKTIWILSIVCILVVVFVSYFNLVSPPSDFPQYSIVTISSGENLGSVVKDFKFKKIIRSPVVFQSLVVLFGGEKRVIAGDYLLENRENAFQLAHRIVRGNFGMEEVKVTIPEGFSVNDIGQVLEKKLVTFDKAKFLKYAGGKEGYLFPDTYFFPPTATSSQVVLQMENNFDQHIKPFENEINNSGHSEIDIIKMASILENEAKIDADRKIVAGILWKRIKIGMALQVDSTLRYVTGRTSSQLTVDDLKMSSPYNTYIYKNLPPTPICNPGMDAIISALEPTSTQYLYFLTGRDGKMYYAKTFEEHIKNKQKYL